MAKKLRSRERSAKKRSGRRAPAKDLKTVQQAGETIGSLTPEKRSAFLAALREHSNVTKACEDLGLSRVSLYAYRQRDEEFSKVWDAAMREGASCLEDEAKRRATGYTEDVYKKGVFVGRVKKYSDLLLLALLNAHWPEKYRRNNAETPPPISPDDQRRLDEARDVLKRLSTEELGTIATVMESATKRAVAQAVAPIAKRTLQ